MREMRKRFDRVIVGERSHSFASSPLSLNQLSVMKRMSTLWLTMKLAISVQRLATPTECVLKHATNSGSEILLGEHEDLTGMEIRFFLSSLVLIL